MRVFKCNVCGVEFYEGHTTCPFCKEPADKATYADTKEERAGSTDLFQYEPCDEDVS